VRGRVIFALALTAILGWYLHSTAPPEALLAETIGVISADLGGREYAFADGRRIVLDPASRGIGYTGPAVGHVIFVGSTPWPWTYVAHPPRNRWWETVKDYPGINAVRPAPGECFVVATSDPHGGGNFSMRDGKIYVRSQWGHWEIPQPVDLVLLPADGFTLEMFDSGVRMRAASLCVNEEGRVWAFDLNTR
jgi:hypothetical protein